MKAGEEEKQHKRNERKPWLYTETGRPRSSPLVLHLHIFLYNKKNTNDLPQKNDLMPEQIL